MVVIKNSLASNKHYYIIFAGCPKLQHDAKWSSYKSRNLQYNDRFKHSSCPTTISRTPSGWQMQIGRSESEKKGGGSKKQIKSQNKNRWGTIRDILNSFLHEKNICKASAAFLKAVSAALIFPEQAHFMPFWHNYHKSQEWKEYGYRTTALLKGPKHVGKAT